MGLSFELAAITRVRDPYRRLIAAEVPIFESSDALFDSLEKGELALDAVIIAHLIIRTRRLPSGLCGLSEDETAIATLMWQTGEYVAGAGENPYGFEKAFLDVKMGNLE